METWQPSCVKVKVLIQVTKALEKNNKSHRTKKVVSPNDVKSFTVRISTIITAGST